MTEYERNDLGAGETETVSFPQPADAPDLFEYPDATSETTVSMDQGVNEKLYTVGGDGNPIHYDPAYAEAYGEATPFFDVPEDETVIQGSAFLYEAIRNADQPVEHVSSQFTAPVMTGQDVMIDRERTEDGEYVTIADAETGDVASTHELTYDMDAVYDEARVEALNTAKAMKPPRAVGADDQLNNLLLEIEADLGDGIGPDLITHDACEEDASDAPYNRVDTFSYEDGSAVDVYLLEPEEALEDEIEAAYQDRVEDDVSMMGAWTEMWTGMFDAWAEANKASIEAGMAMNPAVQRRGS